MTAEEVLSKHEETTSKLSGTKVRIGEKGARRDMVLEAMEHYAHQCVEEALKLKGDALHDYLGQWRAGGAEV